MIYTEAWFLVGADRPRALAPSEVDRVIQETEEEVADQLDQILGHSPGLFVVVEHFGSRLFEFIPYFSEAALEEAEGLDEPAIMALSEVSLTLDLCLSALSDMRGVAREYYHRKMSRTWDPRIVPWLRVLAQTRMLARMLYLRLKGYDGQIQEEEIAAFAVRAQAESLRLYKEADEAIRRIKQVPNES